MSDLLAFREGRRARSGPALLRELSAAVERCSPADTEGTVEALLRAGELECALADAGAGPAVSVLERVTSDLADALLAGGFDRAALIARLAQVTVPASLTLSVPEGFSYYSLHPLDFADCLRDVSVLPAQAAVVGIRSIGVTLSAVVQAQFGNLGVGAARVSVRPAGHPFDRRLELGEPEREWVRARMRANAAFFVVDEGPGLSGSSFLAVAEALEREGVAVGRITLFSSAEPNLNALIAPNAAARWQRFHRIHARPTRRLPADAHTFIGGGRWRDAEFGPGEAWPPAWATLERVKYVSQDGKSLLRFDGHGHYGAAVRERYAQVAARGFGPKPANAGDGFTRFPILNGLPPRSAGPDLLAAAAEYCAWRGQAMAEQSVSLAGVEEMTTVNLQRALPGECDCSISLAVERPVVPDGRMHLHEWRSCGEKWLKFDSAAHGDDHFFPGPCDIAWDLAGAIVEWNLHPVAREFLIGEYRRKSGDRVEARLAGYLTAYAAFQLGYCDTAAAATTGDERGRFLAGRERYLQWLRRSLRELSAGA